MRLVADRRFAAAKLTCDARHRGATGEPAQLLFVGGGPHRFGNGSTKAAIIRRFLREPRRWSNTRFCVSTCAAVGHRPAHKVIVSTSGDPKIPDQYSAPVHSVAPGLG